VDPDDRDGQVHRPGHLATAADRGGATTTHVWRPARVRHRPRAETLVGYRPPGQHQSGRAAAHDEQAAAEQGRRQGTAG